MPRERARVAKVASHQGVGMAASADDAPELFHGGGAAAPRGGAPEAAAAEAAPEASASGAAAAPEGEEVASLLRSAEEEETRRLAAGRRSSLGMGLSVAAFVLLLTTAGAAAWALLSREGVLPGRLGSDRAIGHSNVHRSLRMGSVPRGRCAEYGCGRSYTEKQDCQCNLQCREHENCCEDYEAHCQPLEELQDDTDGSCTMYGCGGDFDPGRSCQCNKDCLAHHSCCGDYGDVCDGGDGGQPESEAGGDGEQPESEAGGDGGQPDSEAPEAEDAPLEENVARRYEGSCTQYGCGGAFAAERPCQCTRECAGDGTCCADFEDTCPDLSVREATKSEDPHSTSITKSEDSSDPAPTPLPTTATSTTTTQERCADVGCGASYDPDRSCQCHLACVSEENCCGDYSTECVGPHASGPHDSDAPLLVDSCDAYGCGESHPGQQCQCDRHCGLNCCSDYISLCVEAGGLRPMEHPGETAAIA